MRPQGPALEACDRGGRIELLRAELLAGLVRMAGMATAGGRDRLQTLAGRAVADVVHERPRAVERRRPEIVGVPAHRIASGITYGAIDALDRRVGGNPRRGVRPGRCDVLAAGARRHDGAVCVL